MKVRVQNYQIIQDIEFDIEGITVISGKTNNGKSALFRAIRAACFGQKGDKFVRHGTSSTMVALQADDKLCSFQRQGKSTIFYLDSKDYPKTGGNAPEEYKTAINMQEIEVGKLKMLPNFSSQFDGLFITGLSPVDAASALACLFSGDKFPQLLKRIVKFVSETKKQITHTEGAIDATDKRVKQLIEIRDTLVPYQHWIDQRQVMESLMTQYDAVAGLVDNFNIVVARVAETATAVAQIMESHKVLNDLDDGLLERHTGLNAASVKLAQAYTQAIEVENVYQERKEISECLDQLNHEDLESRDALAKIITRITLVRREAGEYAEKAMSGSAKLELIETQLSIKLEAITDCPYCESVLSADGRSKLLERVK